VQSVRKTLTFKGAERAKEVQRNIQNELNRVRANQSDHNFRELVDTGVYGKTPTKELPKPLHPVSRSPRILRWIIPDNPDYQENSNTFIWHPHWIFLLIVLTPPVISLILSLILIVVGAQTGILSGLGLIIVTLIVLSGGIFWIAYQIEDHVNDKYIVSPNNIVDVEKKPWGPEDRRSASIGAVQNVTSKTSLISRLIGYGDVFVETAGKGEFTFHRVPRPADVVGVINKYQDAFREGDKERTLKDVLQLMKYYHNEEANRRGNIPSKNVG
jgi:hypothetical protein